MKTKSINKETNKEKMKKNLLNFSVGLIIVILLIIGLTFAFSFNHNFYEKQFEKNNVYDKLREKNKNSDQVNFNLTNENLNKEFFIVTDYVSEKTDYSELNKSKFFNEKEKSHLKDVKKIFLNMRLIFFVLNFILVIIIVTNIYREPTKNLNFKKITRYMNIICSGITLLVLFAYLNFTKAFMIMHEMMFSNDLYLLNSNIDNLIIYLPETIFYSIFLRIFVVFLSIILAINVYNITKHKKNILYTYKNGKKKR